MPPLTLLLKPASSACNLRCAYCFYADEGARRQTPDYGLMSQETARAVIGRTLARAEGWAAFLFQGGEPTLSGLDFYRWFTQEAEAQAPKGLAVRYGIQTNGLVLDQAWCEFLAQKRFLVGLSLDGTRACHDRFRQDAGGQGSWDRALRAAQLLRRAGAEVNALTVVTGPLARHTQSVFAALCKNGFGYQQYIPCLDPLGEPQGRYDWSLTPGEYGEFLNTLFDLWYRELERGRYWSIRYFDNLVRMLSGQPPEQCGMRGSCAVQYVIEADGSVYPCDFYALDGYRLGNIREDSWQALDQARRELGFVERSRRVPEACRACRWYPLCRGGCYRERTPEGQNRYCAAYTGFFSRALPRLRQVPGLLRRCAPPE